MDLSAILSFALGVFLIVYGIMSGGNISSFVSFGSALITIGGTFSAIAISYPLNELKNVPKHLKMIVTPKKYNPEKYVDRLSQLALTARKDGILALESSLEDNEDSFLRSSVLLVVDSIEQTKVKEILHRQLEFMTQRHEYANSIYISASNYAPAFGMIGTVIGLINMLFTLNLSDGPDALATGMAIALVTTFYGTVMANLIFLPISSRLRALHEQELFCKEIIIEGVLAIQDGANPKFIEERLKSFIATSPNSKISLMKNKV